MVGVVDSGSVFVLGIIDNTLLPLPGRRLYLFIAALGVLASDTGLDVQPWAAPTACWPVVYSALRVRTGCGVSV